MTDTADMTTSGDTTDRHEQRSREGEMERGLTSRVGPLEINWPQTIGYYGGLALALGFELIEPPVGVFIAAIPLIKMLNRPRASLPTRFVAQVLKGAAQPVGSEGRGTIWLESQEKRVGQKQAP